MIAPLRTGDRVGVAVSFGAGPVHEQTVIGIFENDLPVAEVAWTRLGDRAIVVDLDDQHWAYGEQLRRLEAQS